MPAALPFSKSYTTCRVRRMEPSQQQPGERYPEKRSAGRFGDGDGVGADDEHEVLVRPVVSPAPNIGAGRHPESGEGLVEPCRSARQRIAGNIVVWQLKSIFNPEYADDVSAAAIGKDLDVPSPNFVDPVYPE